MTPEQTIDLLTLIAARDRRTVGEADVMAWQTDLGDLDFDDCRQAIDIHFRASTDWLLPAHIRRLVKQIREERLGPPGPGLPPAPPAADPDDVPRYLAALRQQRADMAAGRSEAAQALPPGTEPPTDHGTVRTIRAMFDAAQAEARRRKEAERRAESEALSIYLDAVDVLLAEPDHGEAATAAAREHLLGPDGLADLRAAPGTTHEHKVVIWAARSITEEGACAPPAG